ncbi:MAG: hypothetical protein L0H70_06530, partial [Xanthomonadales bacterium]|nr:hypothetical protein [Xanthomonadales bacterium]
VAGDAADNTVEIDVDVTHTASGIDLIASDVDTLVIFRDSFDVPYGDGTQAVSAGLAAVDAAKSSCAGGGVLGTQGASILTLPARQGAAHIDALRTAHAADGSRVVLQRLNIGATPWLRLLASGTHGDERVSAWAQGKPGAQLALGVADDGSHSWLLLEGSSPSLRLQLPGRDTKFKLGTGTCNSR